MNTLLYIEYNSSNNDRAKKNRKNMTKAESKIRYDFLKHRPMWYKFTRQKPINSFILDFYCSKLSLWIEIDGSSHDDKSNYDQMRTIKIWKSGIQIIRFTNNQIFNDLDNIKKSLNKYFLS